MGTYIPAFNETKVAEPKKDGGYEVVKANKPITLRLIPRSGQAPRGTL
jgi:hypothetical protein